MLPLKTLFQIIMDRTGLEGQIKLLKSFLILPVIDSHEESSPYAHTLWICKSHT